MSDSKHLGKKLKTNEGYNIEIIEVDTNKNVKVQFEDGMIRENLDMSNVLNGRIKNLNHLSTCGVGYIGYGKYCVKKYFIYYKIWDKMLRRHYDVKEIKKRVSYTKATMCKEWENFQNFAEWCNENYVEGWTLDKDLLSGSEKIYSPSTCCFLPNDLNNVFSIRTTNAKKLPVGVCTYKNKYRVAFSKYGYPTYYGDFNTIDEALKIYIKYKKEYIIELANKHRELLKEKVYKKLLNFEVKEIYHYELYKTTKTIKK